MNSTPIFTMNSTPIFTMNSTPIFTLNNTPIFTPFKTRQLCIKKILEQKKNSTPIFTMNSTPIFTMNSTPIFTMNSTPKMTRKMTVKMTPKQPPDTQKIGSYLLLNYQSFSLAIFNSFIDWNNSSINAGGIAYFSSRLYVLSLYLFL